MNLRKAVGKNIVPALVITVAYEIAYPILRPLVVTAVRAARAEMTKITKASDRSLPMSERPAAVTKEPALPAPLAEEPAPQAPAATKPARKGSSTSATSTKQ